MVKKVFLSLGCYLLIAFGISLTIKAAIGVSSFNALNVALSEWSHLEVGTVTGCLNSFFLVVSYLLDDKKSKKEYSLMILSVCCLSYAINVFVYGMLPYLKVTSYGVKLCLFLVGICLAGYGTGKILYYGVLTFPIEKCCQLLEYRLQKPFSYFRYGIDMICVTLSLLISLTAQLPLFVREGTIISLVLLSYVIGKAKE
ncbi:YitT family protein [Streptococcus dysgalactiae]|uniref:Integral membrane protein n=1 Tax=Streptococcus dysgalactiae subsp. equisimilis TaxID=119602 RepID=A0AB38Y228_STREQ|nr:membrane protein [Streptococcus dysgalactiae]QQY18100.1 hypothetical protein I6I44_04200 [Streptococcus dysgalactiae]WEQ79606.1 hypothetical protein MGGS36055_00428 [Streptococcus dysgalactiae subsp. equisimilis]WHM79333.1 hypothetical protein OPT59_01060 [Streptococcus dysgalactiae subsp. equisimilis]WJD52425.1 hypothetical protein QRS93_00995 [Streptococcus dysgalactiae subsp. equisimilis]GET67562.1 membrane protein [Streptococcus dysgalactiae subsp. equisimilis]